MYKYAQGTEYKGFNVRGIKCQGLLRLIEGKEGRKLPGWWFGKHPHLLMMDLGNLVLYLTLHVLYYY